MNERRFLFLLGLVLLLRLVSLPVLPLTDDTEARYGIVAREMAASGDWVTPRVWINGEFIPFLGKPPLHFWASALTVRMFGPNEFATRFPSLVSAALLLAFMFVVVRRYVDAEIAGLAALILASCGMFFMLAGAVAIDMTLALGIGGAVLAYYAFLAESARSGKKLWSLAVFAFLALGFLTKGPIAIAMFGIPVFFWTLIHRRWDTLKDHAWWLGIPLFLGLIVPWFLLAEVHNPGFLKYFFVNENMLRFTTRNYGDLYGMGHTAPYGTAILYLLLAGAPWTPWAVVLLCRKAGRNWLRGCWKDERIGIFTLAVAGMTLFLCFARQLLATYLVPVLPFFAVWLAMLFRRSGITTRTVVRVAVGLAVLYLVAIVAGKPIVERRSSTRTIIRAARETRERLGFSGQITFVHRAPYSAYFYGGDILLAHAREAAEQSVRRGLESGNACLFVVHQRDVADIPAPLMAQLQYVCTSGVWSLYRPAASAAR